MRRWALAGSLWLALGCSRSTAPPVAAPAVAPERATLAEDVFVRAAGVGSTEDEAYAAAHKALTTTLLGDPTWVERVPVQVHRRETDPIAVNPHSAGFEVEVGLTRTGAASVLSAFEHAEPTVAGPEAWHEPLLNAVRVYQAVHACERRRELFGSSCEPSATADADEALAMLADGLVLDPAHHQGFPVDGQGHALRNPAVFVLWGGVLLPGMPVVADPEAASVLVETQVRSDVAGRASFEPRPDAVMTPVRVRLDTGALLGPLRDHAPQVETVLEPRAVDWKRWSVAIGRGSKGYEGDDPIMGDVVDGMRAIGAGAPMVLDRTRAQAMLTSATGARSQAAQAIGDAMAGRVDVVLVLEYESRFASRMGGNRVWFEAEGTLEVRSTWTGEVLATTSTEVEVDGLGDDRADRAVRRRLARTLVEQILRERG